MVLEPLGFFLILSMATIKFIPLLDHNTRFSLWQVKMRDVLTQIFIAKA